MLKELKDCYKVQSYPAEAPGFQIWQDGSGSHWHPVLLLPYHSSPPWEICSDMSMGQTVPQIKVLQASHWQCICWNTPPFHFPYFQMQHVPNPSGADRFGPQLLCPANTRASCVQSAFSHGLWLCLATADVQSQREAETYFPIFYLTSFASRLQRD